MVDGRVTKLSREDKLMEIIKKQNKIISELRAINFHHMCLLARYMLEKQTNGSIPGR